MMNKIKDFTKAQGFDNVRYKGRWNSYSYYEMYFEKIEEEIFIGYPNYILVLGGIIRLATIDEIFKIMDSEDTAE